MPWVSCPPGVRVGGLVPGAAATGLPQAPRCRLAPSSGVAELRAAALAQHAARPALWRRARAALREPSGALLAQHARTLRGEARRGADRVFSASGKRTLTSLVWFEQQPTRRYSSVALQQSSQRQRLHPFPLCAPAVLCAPVKGRGRGCPLCAPAVSVWVLISGWRWCV